MIFPQNTPNDLQLLSDAPAHHIFCLLGPVDPAQNTLPEVYCVLQVFITIYYPPTCTFSSGIGSRVGDVDCKVGAALTSHQCVAGLNPHEAIRDFDKKCFQIALRLIK